MTINIFAKRPPKYTRGSNTDKTDIFTACISSLGLTSRSKASTVAKQVTKWPNSWYRVLSLISE